MKQLSLTNNNEPKQRLTDPLRAVKPSQNLYAIMYREMKRLYKYTYDRLETYPKWQKHGIGPASRIAELTQDNLRGALEVYGYNPKLDKEQILRRMSINFKELNVLVELSCAHDWIKPQNREAWSRMISKLDDQTIGFAMGMEKQARERQTKKADESRR